MSAKAKAQEPAGSAEWLEKELREAKARLHKVEGELDQALKQVWSLDAGVHKMADGLSVAGSVTAALQGFREEVRQLGDQISRLQDRQSALTARMEQITGLRHTESTRDRHELGALVKQIDGLGRTLSQYDGRMKALEEVARHVEEEVAGSRLAAQGIERALEEVSTRSARAHEATLRLDQEVSRYAGEFERLQKDDGGLTERLALLMEQLRRTMERLDRVEALAAFPDEARELLQRGTFEREQLAARLGQVERLSTEVSERLAEFVQGLARLDQRTQGQAGELLALAAQLQDLGDQIKAGTKRFYQTLLRQRRRQAETINQEIKELAQGELHSGD